MRKTILGIAISIALLAPQSASAVEPETGCRSFGKSMSNLASEFGPLFGQSVAIGAQAVDGNPLSGDRRALC